MDITQNVVDLTVCEFVIEILINALGNLYMYNVYILNILPIICDNNYCIIGIVNRRPT